MEARTDPQQDLCGIDGAGIFAGCYFGEGWYGPSPFSFLRSSDVLLREIDALVLWELREQLGFGNKRLKKFYDNFSRGIEALIRRYEMEQGDDVWLCTYKLKEIGCDLEKWEKERGDQ